MSHGFANSKTYALEGCPKVKFKVKQLIEKSKQRQKEDDDIDNVVLYVTEVEAYEITSLCVN